MRIFFIVANIYIDRELNLTSPPPTKHKQTITKSSQNIEGPLERNAMSE